MLIKNIKGCKIWGIDNDPKSIPWAKNRLDKAILSDADSLNLPLKNNYFDLIIFSNILEHLARPQKVLLNFRKYLKKKGYIIVALPNAVWLPVRVRILFGRFNYTKYGILDRTHLRFFTFKTSKELIENAGFEILTVSTNFHGWRNTIAKIRPTLLASQFVFLCKKS